ncbi:ABC transporter ATP-binding protein [Litorivita pollutaquae]|uniref:ABC transporter ATP-binding protein n=1 Tax=Litorivita pollutaquae TaxID=2200892 RepID=A0A2V4NRE9_9RHOB|nr:ABC transporter ATP-binding protein [Litorivita pollutaquae]OUS20459.1 ABC transporter ATP-binding protein [Rhodobacterales bacterium 59_46_T64]PYC49117.1 ABC transporter ATP-binding protein [Litorivita pollutaquae]
MIELENVEAWYGASQALFGVTFRVNPGELVALVGVNGAGKTTIVRVISGLVRSSGQIRLDGRDITATPAYQRFRQGDIAVVLEGRGMLPELTVIENIILGLDGRHKDRLDEVLELFPVLRARHSERVSNLSGGEQQMVALARAIVRRPRLLILDEPSLGLAPLVVNEVYATLEKLRAQFDMTILLIEQNIAMSRKVADRLYLVRSGRIASEIDATDVNALESLSQSALGVDGNH